MRILKIKFALLLRVSIRKTFAQYLRNETQNFSFVAHQFCAKKNSNLRNHSQKSFRAKLPYSAFSPLEFCAIPQFRYKHMCVFLGIERFFAGRYLNSGKNLVLECFAILVTLTCTTCLTVKISSGLMGAHLIH